jgi:hypothetical protein
MVPAQGDYIGGYIMADKGAIEGADKGAYPMPSSALNPG